MPRPEGAPRRLPGLTAEEGFVRHPFDIEHHVQTSGLVPGRDLTTGHAHDMHNTAYYGIAPSVLEALCDRWQHLPLDGGVSNYSFIDMGAGMGRAMLLASRLPFREVIGVEINPLLVAIAEENIERWTGPTLRTRAATKVRAPLRMVCQDATEFVFPDNPCAVYLFNPFRAPVLKSLLRHLEKSFAGRAEQLDVLYANDECAEVFDRSPRWRLEWRGNIALSPEDYAADSDILARQPGGEYATSFEEQSAIYRFVG